MVQIIQNKTNGKSKRYMYNKEKKVNGRRRCSPGLRVQTWFKGANLV